MATFIEDFYCGKLLKNYGAAKNCHHKQVNVYTTKPPVIQQLTRPYNKRFKYVFYVTPSFRR